MASQAERDYYRDCALRAVEILNVWSNSTHGGKDVQPYIRNIVDEEGAEGLTETVMGLINVSGFLLASFSQQSGTTEQAILAETARQFIRLAGSGD